MAILLVNRKALHYCPVRRDEAVLRHRNKDIATTRIRYGYKRITVLLRREGWLVNIKRVRRLYREEGLALRAHRLSAGVNKDANRRRYVRARGIANGARSQPLIALQAFKVCHVLGPARRTFVGNEVAAAQNPYRHIAVIALILAGPSVSELHSSD